MAPNGVGIALRLGFLFRLFSLVYARPPFGLQIYSCVVPGVIAPGFDDGPWIYSESVLDRYVLSSEIAFSHCIANMRDRMEAAEFKATWFINGQNKGNIYDYSSTLHRMVNLGHQIGSHT
jgi:hypothetical protein